MDYDDIGRQIDDAVERQADADSDRIANLRSQLEQAQAECAVLREGYEGMVRSTTTLLGEVQRMRAVVLAAEQAVDAKREWAAQGVRIVDKDVRPVIEALDALDAALVEAYRKPGAKQQDSGQS